jgi:uncharacterized protein
MSGIIERRSIGTREIRSTQNANGQRILSGYAAKYGTPIGKAMQRALGFTESCAPGCFNRSITSGADVICTQDHDPKLLMGRTKNKTLTLRSDNTGLYFSCVMPDTQAARDLHTLVNRGDINGCSFQFIANPKGEKWGKTNGQVTRSLTDVDLIDVSAVAMPAYDDTEVASRGDKECDEDDEDCDDDRSLQESERMIRSCFPNGIPAEVRGHIPNIVKRFSKTDENELWLANARVRLALVEDL